MFWDWEIVGWQNKRLFAICLVFRAVEHIELSETLSHSD